MASLQSDRRRKFDRCNSTRHSPQQWFLQAGFALGVHSWRRSSDAYAPTGNAPGVLSDTPMLAICFGVSSYSIKRHDCGGEKYRVRSRKKHTNASGLLLTLRRDSLWVGVDIGTAFIRWPILACTHVMLGHSRLAWRMISTCPSGQSPVMESGGPLVYLRLFHAHRRH